jgi:hypothetical protein
MSGPQGAGDRARLSLIRIALLAGVLLFGGVTYYLHSRPGWEPNGDIDAGMLRLVMQIVWVLGIGGVVALYLVARRIRDRDKVIKISIVAWALGEAIALTGGMLYFVTNEPRGFLLGLGAMVLTFLVFPVQ